MALHKHRWGNPETIDNGNGETDVVYHCSLKRCNETKVVKKVARV